MGPFSTLYLIVSLIVILFLSFKCIVLTKAYNTYLDLVMHLINDQQTRNDIKIIASAMYDMTMDEFERRMKE